MKKRIIASLAIFAGLFLLANPVFADEERTLDSVDINRSYTFVYSGGKWICAGTDLYFYGSDISASSGNINCRGKINLTAKLPSSVMDSIKSGAEIKANLSSPTVFSNLKIESFDYRISTETISFSLGLIPKIAAGTSLNSYVSGLNPTIPLIDYKYGKNIYTVYPPLGEPTQAEGHGTASIPLIDNTIGKVIDIIVPLAGTPSTVDGWYASTIPSYVNGTYIHPSEIKNNKGYFVSGTRILFNGKEKNAAFYAIGKNGSFLNGEAVSLCFYAPMKITFSEIIKDSPKDEPESTIQNTQTNNGSPESTEYPNHNQTDRDSDYTKPENHLFQNEKIEQEEPIEQESPKLRLHRVR